MSVVREKSLWWVTKNTVLKSGHQMTMKTSSSATSREGVSISTSLQPAFWSWLLKIPGPAYELSRSDGEEGKFLLPTEKDKAKALEWAVKEGWITIQNGWGVQFPGLKDPEGSVDREKTEEAVATLRKQGLRADVVRIPVPVASDKMLEWWAGYFRGFGFDTGLLPLYVSVESMNLWVMAKKPSFDGVWYPGTMGDPDRAGILPHAIERWEVSASMSKSRLKDKVEKEFENV